jgi:DNA-binding NarL/FixJ family response regulator
VPRLAAPAGGRLTTFDADELVLRALQAGAAGFLLKDTAPADIVAAIEAVHAGDGSLSPAIARRLIRLVAGNPDTAARQKHARRALRSPPASTRSPTPSPKGTPTPTSPPSCT